MRTTIRTAAPEVKETISYQMSAFKLHGIWSTSPRERSTSGYTPRTALLAVTVACILAALGIIMAAYLILKSM